MPKVPLDWTPEKDQWELYNLDEDWTQANDLAAKMPEKLEQMKALFLVESAKNLNLPIGGGLWTPVFHPEDGPGTPYNDWTFSGPVSRMPEFAAPKIGKTNNVVGLEVDIPANANGVLYALGAFSGGLSCYVKDGVLCYEYNLFEIERTRIKAKEKLPVGKATIEVETKLLATHAGSPAQVTLKVNGKEVASGQVPITAPLAFTANDCLDFGSDLGSPVSLDYFDAAPFKFNGTLGTSTVKYIK